MTAVPDMTGLFRSTFATAARLAVDDPKVLVSLGHPGKDKYRDDIVFIGDVSSHQDFGPVSTLRQRDVTMQLEVIVSCFRKGAATAEQVVHDRAFDLLSRIEEYVRVTDTTLRAAAGRSESDPVVVWWCFCTDVGPAGGSRDEELVAKGRLIEIPATFTAVGRITS
jgi:hypothetical protein